MYKKQEILQLKKEFWTSIGQYMAPVSSASGEKINWINYKTGVKDIYFRMDAGNGTAAVSIELTHKDSEVRERIFKKLELFRPQLEDITGEEWQWKLHNEDEHGRPCSAVSMTLQAVNIFDKNTWPQLISFLKPRMIAFDRFWTEVKEFFRDQ